MKRFLDLADFTREEVVDRLALAQRLQDHPEPHGLAGRVLGLLFLSTRPKTRDPINRGDPSMRELMSMLCLLSISVLPALAQGIPKPPADQLVVRPKGIDDVLSNRGIGFHTFQRFNGDALNPGIRWTEGHPIEYQEFDGDLTNPDHPAATTAYFRVYWRYVETGPGQYNWPMLDKALKTAAQRGQTLCLRIAPYGGGDNEDVPAWYRSG